MCGWKSSITINTNFILLPLHYYLVWEVDLHRSLDSNLRLPLKINHISKENCMQFGHKQMKVEVANSKVLLKLTKCCFTTNDAFFHTKGYISQQRQMGLSSIPLVWPNNIWTCIITCCYSYLYFFWFML